MDIDAEDNIYLITEFHCKMFVFDENGNKRFETSLHFLPSFQDRKYMALNKDGKIAILDYVEKTIYVRKVCLEQNLYEVEKRLFPIQVEMLNLKIMLYLKILLADFNSTKNGSSRLA